ncbi:MAG: hypothetical protein EAY75_11770 [Bacteroidetes bacterium]|nr:MAG: hypothetical protein EAY75_11770 [Bacteroidota bacterium]
MPTGLKVAPNQFLLDLIIKNAISHKQLKRCLDNNYTGYQEVAFGVAFAHLPWPNPMQTANMSRVLFCNGTTVMLPTKRLLPNWAAAFSCI